MQSRSMQRHSPTSKAQTKDTAVMFQQEESQQAFLLEQAQEIQDIYRNSVAYPGMQKQYLKRAMDISGAVVGILAFLPVFIVTAILIKIDSRGPAVFKQTRLGKYGKQFTFYKFRSMYDGNDSTIHRQYVTSLIHGDSSADLKGKNGSFKLENDPRVTRFGRILRRTSLDELPQFFNVLKGDMSLVGPRPPIQYEVDQYTSHHKRRLSVMPGITGWWQVNGRTEKNFEEMIELDLFYIDNWSLWLDIKILYLTVLTVFNRKGAW